MAEPAVIETLGATTGLTVITTAADVAVGALAQPMLVVMTTVISSRFVNEEEL
jgi:hypothetical protein